MTVVSFPGDACPLRRSEGDVFLPEFGTFSWNWTVEVNPLPRGASVGELGKKTFHPRNVGFTEFISISANKPRDEKFCIMKRKHS
jgi:hypothetical protein